MRTSRLNALQWSIALSMAVLVAVVFAQVVLRYLTYQPVAWTEELARFLFIWLSLVGAAEGARRGAHFSVELLPNALRGSRGRLFRCLIRVLEAIAYGVLAYAGVRILEVVHSQRSITLDLPMSFAYASISVGATLMCVYTLIRAGQALRERGAG